MTEDLVLPVPEVLSAFYLVPSDLTAEAAKDQARSALSAHVADPVGTVARKTLEVGVVKFASRPASSFPPFPTFLQQHLGVSADLLDVVTAANDLVLVAANWPPGWPPVHETVARASAGALATALGVPVVDLFVPKVLAPAVALRSLPDADYNIKLSDWVLVFQSAGEHGLWLTTKGLSRFGLPELQALSVPPQLGLPWTFIMTGIANRLLKLWLDVVNEPGDPGFARLPALIQVSKKDVESAYGRSHQGNSGTGIRLAFDPSPDVHSDSFLTVQPPDEYSNSLGEFMAYVSEAVLGAEQQDVRYTRTSPAMEAAMQAARASLPVIRTRLMSGELPLNARLMIKHRVELPQGDEYPWAYVNSWKEPDKVLANSAGNAAGHERIRAGRPIVVAADAIVDWAVWVDGRGIIEGGETNKIALREGRQANSTDEAGPE